jgi:hypothetical protein
MSPTASHLAANLAIELRKFILEFEGKAHEPPSTNLINLFITGWLLDNHITLKKGE